LQFVKEQKNKIAFGKLLNDNAGARLWVRAIIRDRYGPQWLNRIQPVHFAKYGELEERKR